MRGRGRCIPALLSVVCYGGAPAPLSEYHVWQKVEIVLHAQKQYRNPYTEVTVWVTLRGPGFSRRCYGFWDGGSTFRVRVVAVREGVWEWESSSEPYDPGLSAKRGRFRAIPWTEEEKRVNPCRRGMLKPAAGGHGLAYADGTPCFFLADTWWACGTFRFPYRQGEHAIGPEAGFQDYVRFRRSQRFNGIALIAAFPNWENDDKPAHLVTPGGVVLRSAWGQAGTRSAESMVDEEGNRAFMFPGKVPGFERYFPDVTRVNPAYFRNLDRKIDFLNACGMIPFIEVARRDVGQAWKRYYRWPDSYVRYVHYVWSRYQANVCLFSPVHLDSTRNTIAVSDWNAAANEVIERYRPPPFGTLRSCNSAGSSLRLFDHRSGSQWITLHQIGNRRTHDCYALLTEIYHAAPPLPGLNGEPYYDGMLDAPGGSEKAARYCRSAVYGSVLSGGLAGHIYGAGGWKGGLWSGNVEEACEVKMWDAMKWRSAAQAQHLLEFLFSEGRRFQYLRPQSELLTPNRHGPPRSCDFWAFCARSPGRDLFLVYFEKGCPQAVLSGAEPKGRYEVTWFDPRTGTWSTPQEAAADRAGRIALPPFPGGESPSGKDWALKVKKKNR